MLRYIRVEGLGCDQSSTGNGIAGCWRRHRGKLSWKAICVLVPLLCLFEVIKSMMIVGGL